MCAKYFVHCTTTVGNKKWQKRMPRTSLHGSSLFNSPKGFLRFSNGNNATSPLRWKKPPEVFINTPTANHFCGQIILFKHPLRPRISMILQLQECIKYCKNKENVFGLYFNKIYINIINSKVTLFVSLSQLKHWNNFITIWHRDTLLARKDIGCFLPI